MRSSFNESENEIGVDMTKESIHTELLRRLKGRKLTVTSKGPGRITRILSPETGGLTPDEWEFEVVYGIDDPNTHADGLSADHRPLTDLKQSRMLWLEVEAAFRTADA